MKSHKQKISHLAEIPDVWELSYPQKIKKSPLTIGLKIQQDFKVIKEVYRAQK